ncbi:two-component system sensor histidine kinase DesK [Amycolatopsis thermophila]|uniref:Two-component system sensor histidine kinase DesK n=1 Tax=Amycolatopsis thermophila TaxID=206084 RepID=A0ABU0ENA6_9PSEU|nr:sensor histidine kinase [Amycolatopsis thermophila]MDQ0376297.1 two-component system sensor histidine kinase DesK [Amycolatopsis thermophila]
MDSDDRAGWWSDTSTSRARAAAFRRRWPVLGAVFFLAAAIPSGRGEGPLVIGLLAVYGACYMAFPFFLLPHRRMPVRLTFAAVLVVLGWAVLVTGGSVYMLLYTTVVIALSLPPGWVLLFDGLSVAGGGLLVLLHAGVHGTPGDFGTVFGITSAMFFMGRLSQTVRRLRQANEEIAALAVGAERERLARDLHDILGHSLTTIAVKAGLARRLIESAADPERAVTEIREVEGLARSALSDVRATVSEYREVSLSAELVGARAALRAAEIEADLPSAVDNVRPELQTTFGYVLREAVTNVLRHSGASRVKVRLGRNWLEITDNGRGVEPGVAGNGLRGLTERLAQVGGTLQVRARPGEGFQLRAEVPATRPVEVS